MASKTYESKESGGLIIFHTCNEILTRKSIYVVFPSIKKTKSMLTIELPVFLSRVKPISSHKSKTGFVAKHQLLLPCMYLNVVSILLCT